MTDDEQRGGLLPRDRAEGSRLNRSRSTSREPRVAVMSDTTPGGRSRPLSREEAQAWQLETFAGRNLTLKEIAVREAAARIEGERNG